MEIWNQVEGWLTEHAPDQLGRFNPPSTLAAIAAVFTQLLERYLEELQSGEIKVG